MEDYCASFKPGGIDDVLDHYHETATMMMGSMVFSLDREGIRAALESGLEDLLEKGFAYSRFNELQIQQLNPELAYVSGSFTRYKADDSVLEQLGATYTLIHVEGQWKIVVIALHGPDECLSLPGDAAGLI